MHLLRVLLAALVGAVIVFTWGAVAHMALKIGENATQSLPNADALVPQLQTSMNERSVYFFPPEEGDTKEAMEAWKAKYEAGPRGIIVYDPTPDIAPMSPTMLGTEFATNFIGALIAAIILSMLCGPLILRGILIGLMGVFAVMAIDLSYWNWYRFPMEFVTASLIEQSVGWVLAGLAMAAIVRPCRGGVCHEGPHDRKDASATATA